MPAGIGRIKEAIQISRRLEAYQVLIEEPCHGITAQEEVRRAVDTPIIADETCHTIEDATEIARRRAADLLSIRSSNGGLWKARQIAAIAQGAGLGYRVDGVRGETRVSTTASAHLATSLRKPVASGLMQHARLAEDIVVEGGSTFANGRVSAPDAPGLGLKVREYGELVARVE
ncbi:MAG: enolase C-terminal domain-like protein [Anaerolineae bacterium]